MNSGDVYRHAASLLVLKPTDVRGSDGSVSYDLLLLHKPRKNDDWQLPQGGLEEGETTEQAALRELNEEAGISSAMLLGKSDHVYQYDFPPSYRRFRPDNICGQRIEYVFAVVPQDVVVTVDNREVDAFIWIPIEELETYVTRKEYLNLTRQLYDEALVLVKQQTV